MDDIDSYELPNTLLMVKDNIDLHEPSTSSFYLNPRLDADLDINDTENEAELEDFEEPPYISGKNQQYQQFKEYIDFSTAKTDLKVLS